MQSEQKLEIRTQLNLIKLAESGDGDGAGAGAGEKLRGSRADGVTFVQPGGTAS